MAHIHSVYDTDLHFMIDPITRAITNQSTSKTKVIQFDHNSERFTFEIPRYVDGHDMTLCDKIEVHYANISANKSGESRDVYIVDDMAISPASDDVVIFSWLLSQNATKHIGSLNFVIRFYCLDGDQIVYLWSTGICSNISVSEGMANGEAVITIYSDVLETYKAEIIEAVLAEFPVAEEVSV